MTAYLLNDRNHHPMSSPARLDRWLSGPRCRVDRGPKLADTELLTLAADTDLGRFGVAGRLHPRPSAPAPRPTVPPGGSPAPHGRM